MYICNCKGINEKRFKETMQQGAQSLGQVREQTNLGSCCGKCIDHAKKVLQGELQKAS